MKRKFLLFAFTASMLFLISCGQQPTQGVQSSLSWDGEIKNVRVLTNPVDVKTGCSSTTPTLQTSSKDNVLNVISKVADWYAVKLPSNNIGFVPQSQVKPIVIEGNYPNTPNTTPGTGTSTTSPTTPNATAPTAPKTPSTGSQTNANSNSLTAEENQMVNLVNQARAQNNVAALQVDMALTKVARIKAQDMIDNNYFSHNSPTYGSPFDMMKKFGINYVKAGENIAGNQGVSAAHTALMNSPGHRANILDPDFTHVGIGIKKGGPYGLMISQMFISKPR